MIDTQIRNIIDKPLILIARLAIKAGANADHITYAGFVVGILAGVAITFDAMMTGFCLIVASRFCDGLDGTVARLQGPTDKGAFLDIAFDFLFYSWIPLCFAFHDPQNALAAAFLIFCFIGTGTSFLSYAAIAEKRGIDPSYKGKKGIYYLGGITEGTETILFLLACCYWPTHFVLFAFIFGALCLVTTALRIYRGIQDF